MLPAPAPQGQTPPGTVPLFTFRGIRVFLHWTWLLVAWYHIEKGQGDYPHVGWDIAEYVMLFVIVLMHEFGHAFATRQVGGTADQILLWPFGGIAFVQTPPRPGAYLWGIAAGPLVNAALWPVLYGLKWWCVSRLQGAGAEEMESAFYVALFVSHLYLINTALLIFNLLPIYPMDGGQLFRGLLWLKVGPLKSMLIAAWTGLVLGGGLIAFVLIRWGSYWLAIVLGLMVMQSWQTIAGIRAYQQRGRGQ